MAIDCGGYSNFNPYRKFDYCPDANSDFESLFKMKHSLQKNNFITTESFEQLILAKNNLKYYYHNIF
jgi:hypothetical protein